MKTNKCYIRCGSSMVYGSSENSPRKKQRKLVRNMCDFFRVFQTILRFFKMFSVEVQLFYNAVLVSAVQQSELVTCV